ncbi:hypothetical protein GCM10027589_22520 [Actinocorallia lasiicapitis]
MCCDHLVCASCAGPVAEGRCGSCRAVRAQMHGQQGGFTPQQLAIAAALLLILAFSLLAPHLA